MKHSTRHRITYVIVELSTGGVECQLLVPASGPDAVAAA